ncbi:sorting nexin-18 [Stomoxys calcitrans]|nr:sorting nexin-18 [Stomoxys calcitrans]
MNSYVRALYDFRGDPGQPELSIDAGEVLQITRTDVGEGWWEGQNSRGDVGRFPEAYVEVMSAADVKHTQSCGGETYSAPLDAVTKASSRWDDDDTEDDDIYTPIEQPDEVPKKSERRKPSLVGGDDILLPPTLPDMDDPAANAKLTRKTSMFGKRAEPFILGHGNKNQLLDNELIYIVPFAEQYFQWKSSDQFYSVVVASPKKETKFKGMKSFVAYQLTPSFNNVSVSRRFKHFVWLHQRLLEKFVLIPIPPLPDKQVSGRYEDQFVEHRRVQLQEFVDWICRHPVLSKCEVWFHFLTCTDDSVWKQGKRKAERDPYVGISYCWAISPPEKQLLASYVDSQIDNWSQFIQAMDGSVRNLLAISSDVSKRYQNQCRKEFQRVAFAIHQFSRSIAMDEERQPPPETDKSLAMCISSIGDTYAAIAKDFGEQPKLDWVPFADKLQIYRSVLNSFPDILTTHKGALQKRHECERLTAEQKMTPTQMIDVNRRTDVITYAVIAEMSHFRKQRETHFKDTLKTLIEEQMKFYNGLISKLQDAYAKFD